VKIGNEPVAVTGDERSINVTDPFMDREGVASREIRKSEDLPEFSTKGLRKKPCALYSMDRKGIPESSCFRFGDFCFSGVAVLKDRQTRGL